MSAQTTLPLDDAAATPVTWSYLPQGRTDTDTWVWEAKPAGQGQLATRRLTMTFSRPSPQRSSTKVTITLSVPVLETVVTGTTPSGYVAPEAVAWTDLYALVVVAPIRSQLQARKDTRKMFYMALNTTQLKSVLEDLENVW
jgi:hypothetical protein